ncbi:MAG: DUF1330 domain-containing protein [Usitatibacter sp.]
MPAYVLAEIEVTNPEGYKGYTAVVGESIRQYGGRFLVRGGAAHALEGEWPSRRRVILEFPSADAARKWWDSPEYEKPKALRRANSTGRLILLEGLDG